MTQNGRGLTGRHAGDRREYELLLLQRLGCEVQPDVRQDGTVLREPDPARGLEEEFVDEVDLLLEIEHLGIVLSAVAAWVRGCHVSTALVFATKVADLQPWRRRPGSATCSFLRSVRSIASSHAVAERLSVDRYNALISRARAADPILIDGATGSECIRRGAPLLPNGWSGGAALSDPDIVRQVHTGYLEIGAELIASNTFATGRNVLRDAGVEGRLRGVQPARSGARRRSPDRSWRSRRWCRGGRRNQQLGASRSSGRRSTS